MTRQLDLRAACEAFVAVARRESFTAGATAAGLTQSVASRRVAALEAHLGAPLFERSSRRVELTAFGRGVLASAIKLVDAAAELEDDAERARRRPIALAVPGFVDAAAAARLCADAAPDAVLELVPATPAERADGLRSGRFELALLHVEPDRAEWSSPLGVASATRGSAPRPFHFAELRGGRGAARLRRLHLSPEDDVPQVRDRVERVRNGAGLVPAQLRVAASTISAMAAAHGDDLVLATPVEAAAHGLHWHPLGELHLGRGYALGHRDAALAGRVREAIGERIPALLGATARVPAGASA
ncbi:LysR family transcriptional regulator [Agromyces seonyuensis]|uniref:LysR family transcriptional regulator n=1 Tax=Agromyces seonyuensis TaxID=2662446 RepID=A0A6I4P0T2_9MICO|nr:LysR family transcriptional regulator [Agromyces seonyuensis]MWB99971.1 LysR family transcriptional regulator [Agromyces seonyuensis]